MELLNNRKMFELHDPISGLAYKTTNVFSSSKEVVYFICDPPHLIKTIRNCFARGHLWVSVDTHSVVLMHIPLFLQCNGQSINRNYVAELYKENAGLITEISGLCLVPKIKYVHVHLTSFSKMRVDLAAQVC